ncbi:MAG: type III-B CRISPR module-associated protein Cmr3 [Nitrospirota bacterium]
MKLFIEPNDILMFRDGKPFSGDDDHFARGSFPPPPSTVYGALRSHILSTAWPEFSTFADKNGVIPEHIKQEIGTPAEKGALTIKLFAIAKKNSKGIEQYFPMPRDIAKDKGKENGGVYILKPDNKLQDTVMTDLPSGLQHLWHPTEDALEAAAGFLSSSEMWEYLIGNIPKSTDADKIFKTEERTGIGKSRTTRSVETGRLYSVEYFRLNGNCGFAVEVGNTKLLPESGMLRLGGDNRSARYSTVSWNDIQGEPIKKKILETKRFKLILTTHAIFTNGWMPGGIDDKTMEGSINGIAVRLISACIGKPIGIGGFDMAKGMPKPMKKAAPAGSVYYFELKDSNVDNLFGKLWLKSISDEKSQEGFGITLIGGF